MRQVLRPGALGRPRGMGWGGRCEGGLGGGIHVNPWLIHVNAWQKPLQYCKVISPQLIKINGKINGKKYISDYMACNKKNYICLFRLLLHLEEKNKVLFGDCLLWLFKLCRTLDKVVIMRTK